MFEKELGAAVSPFTHKDTYTHKGGAATFFFEYKFYKNGLNMWRVWLKVLSRFSWSHRASKAH